LDERASRSGHLIHYKRYGESSDKAMARRERRVVAIIDVISV